MARVLSLIVAAVLPLSAQVSVNLNATTPIPAPVGSAMSWSTEVTGDNSGDLWYRFRVRHNPDGEFRTVRDFAPLNTLDWAGPEAEGNYVMEVTVRDRATDVVVASSVTFEITPRVASGMEPLISDTSHPLVALYSAPPCAPGSKMRVQFTGVDSLHQYTPFKDCVEGKTLNFYLAGAIPDSGYWIQQQIQTGNEIVGGPYSGFGTLAVRQTFPTFNVTRPIADGAKNEILLQSPLFSPPMATDLNGKIKWFYPGNISLTRPVAGGLFLGFVQVAGGDPSLQLIREFNLAGATTRETNAARINEQLAQMGKRQITGFHHEVAPLPGGKILALASTEQLMTDVQGQGTVDVLGDMILVLDQDLQVLWTWDAFDHLDPHRVAPLNDTCLPDGGGCPPFRLAPIANDWLHGNSVQLTPDGNLIFSIRHQEWVILIDYANGSGSGGVIWKFGKDGDFQLTTDDPDPWFSHQHDAKFDGKELMLFDNGNARDTVETPARSRGQVFKLDVENRKATFVMNADLGAYAFALGSAQKLPNGNYHFNLGILLPALRSRSVEVDPTGKIVYSIDSSGAFYRTFRMRDMYTPE